MASLTKTSLYSLLIFVAILQSAESQNKPTWSICNGGNGFGNCYNAISSGDCAAVSNLRPVSASVEGMFLFYGNEYDGGQEANATGRFLFMDTFGLKYSLLLGDGVQQLNCIRRVSDQFDYKKSTITTFGRLEFLTDNMIGIISDDEGSPDNCTPYITHSLIISGNEPWTIYRADGTSACIRVVNTNSFIPGLVRDTRTIGFEHNTICAFRKGCHSSQGIFVENTETEGVLRRTE